MGDANRVEVSDAIETAFGTARTGVNYQKRRITSESLKQDTGTTTSQEIDATRQVKDVVRNSLSASGDIAFELSYGAFDDWFEEVLQADSTWTGLQQNDDVSTTITAATGVVAGTGIGTSFTANQWARLRQTSNAANSTFYKMSAASANEFTAVNKDKMVDEGPTAGVDSQQGAQILNGTTFVSRTIETYATDDSLYQQFVGMALNGFSLAVTADGIVTGTFTWLGKAATSPSPSSSSGSGYDSAPSNDVMNAVDNAKLFTEGGTSYDITSFNLQMSNNLRQRLQVATLGPISLGSGTIDISGSVEAFFSAKTQLDKYLAFTKSSLAIAFEDAAGNGYVIELPAVRYTDGRANAGGINTDVVLALDFTAYRDSSELITIRITRFPAWS